MDNRDPKHRVIPEKNYSGSLAIYGGMNEKVVLITGAASGIGAEVACQLYEKGAKLVLVDLDTTQLKEISGRLGEDRVLGVVADVCDLSAMQAAVDSGIERFGDIDVVVANAGIATYGSVRQVDPLRSGR